MEQEQILMINGTSLAICTPWDAHLMSTAMDAPHASVIKWLANMEHTSLCIFPPVVWLHIPYVFKLCHIQILVHD